MVRKLFLTIAAAFAAAFLAAIAIAILDLYLTGHGYPSVTRESVTWDAAGVHLSPGDIALLMISTLAAAVTWWSTRRIRSRP